MERAHRHSDHNMASGVPFSKNKCACILVTFFRKETCCVIPDGRTERVCTGRARTEAHRMPLELPITPTEAKRQAAAEGLSLVPAYNQALTPSYPTLPHQTPPCPVIPHHTPPHPPLPYPTQPYPTPPRPTPPYPRLASRPSHATRALLGRGSPAHTHNSRLTPHPPHPALPLTQLELY